jgi:small subunit ribosomal protein S10
MKYRIVLKSLNIKIFKFSFFKIINFFKKEKINYKVIILPIKIKKFCVLSSPHIDKDSREQYEIRIYKGFINFEINNLILFNNLLKIILPSGINCIFKILK